jgi:hypothetical protein
MPTVWELSGVALGVIGILLAVPPFFQMKYGRPVLEATLGHSTICDGAYKLLFALVWNRPIRGRTLAWLGVTRSPIAELMASVEVSESGSGRIVSPMTPIDIGDLSKVWRPAVEFPASTAGKIVSFVMSDQKSGEVVLFKKPRLQLAPGQYRARVRFSVEGIPFECDRDFLVQSVAPFLNWQGVTDSTVVPMRVRRSKS